MPSVLQALNGKNGLETAENYSMAGVLVGAALFAAGIGLAVISPAGPSAMLAMIGAIVSFVSAVALVFSWLAKEISGVEG